MECCLDLCFAHKKEKFCHLKIEDGRNKSISHSHSLKNYSCDRYSFLKSQLALLEIFLMYAGQKKIHLANGNRK